MKAVKIINSEAVLAEVEPPNIGDLDLLVKVGFAGINAADLLQIAGHYRAPQGTPQDLLGLEYSGMVVGQGAKVPTQFNGKKVMGIASGAAQAEYIAIRFDQVIALPNDFDLLQAGAIPEAFITAYDAIFTQGNFAIGKRILITGATGGVGSAAVTLAVTAGGIVFGTSRNDRAKQFVHDLGAHAIAPDQISQYAPYDTVIELIGGESFPTTLPSLASGGTIVTIGISGNPAIELDLRLLMQKRATIRGSTLRSRDLAEKAEIAAQFSREILPLFISGKIKPVVDSVYSANEVRLAYHKFANEPKTGKLLLRFSE